MDDLRIETEKAPKIGDIALEAPCSRPTRLWQSIMMATDNSRCLAGEHLHGRLWATWYSGNTTENEYNWLVLIQATTMNNWAGPAVVIDPVYPVRALILCFGLIDGHVAVLSQSYYKFDGRAESGLLYRQSGDANPSWSEPVRIANTFAMNKPLFLVTAHGCFLRPFGVME